MFATTTKSLAVRSVASRAVAAPAARTSVRAVPLRARVVMRATPADLEKEAAAAIKKAEEACKSGTTADCAVAWDVVEELDAARSHKQAAQKADPKNDPLEQFCEGNPDADECRVYDD